MIKVSLIYKVEDDLTGNLTPGIELTADEVLDIHQLMSMKQMGMDVSHLPLEIFDQLQARIREQLVNKCIEYEHT